MKRFKIIFSSLSLILGCHITVFPQVNPADHLVDSIASLKDHQLDSNEIKNLLDISQRKYNQAVEGNGNLVQAIDASKNCFQLSKKINFKRGFHEASYLLGLCYGFQEDYSASRQYHYAALKMALEEGNKIQAFVGYYNIGITYNMQGDFRQALENHFAGLGILRKIKAEKWYPVSYVAIGEVYTNMDNFAEASRYLDDAYILASKENEKILLGKIFLDQGKLLFAQKKPDIALTRYFSALKYLNTKKSLQDLADLYYALAGVYMQKGFTEKDVSNPKKNFLTSITYLQKTINLQNKFGIQNKSLKGYHELIEAYTEVGDYKNALNYYEQYSKNVDSSVSISLFMKLSELKTKYEKEKLTDELKAKSEKDKIKEEASQAQVLAEQKLKQERVLFQEKDRYEKSISAEKINEQKANIDRRQTNNMLIMGLALIILTSGFIILFRNQKNLKQRALAKAEEIHKMAELEMQSLRSQLNPHFMFNSLNSVQALILKNENEKSHSYLARFAKLLRMLLENADTPFISLSKELEFLKLYLALESLRVPDLQYSISKDPSLNSDQILIPNMILQPYVENAIWHGLFHKNSDKRLQIKIYPQKDAIMYEIEDNGIGRKNATEYNSLFRKQHQSKGMELLTKRIKLLNDQYATTIQTAITDLMVNTNETGTLVRITIPLNFSGINQA